MPDFDPIPVRFSNLFKKCFLFLTLLLATTYIKAQTRISWLEPSTGRAGTTVQIYGSNFSPANNTVFFGATKATVLYEAPNYLEVKVPAGATYNRLSVSNNGLTAYSPAFFTPTFSGLDADFTASTFPVANRTDLAAQFYPAGFVLSQDFDGDGLPDLFNISQTGLSVYRNTSVDGAISFATRIDKLIGSDMKKVAVGDFDGDGKPDLAISFSLHLIIYKNTSTPGNISFTNAIQKTLYAINGSSAGYLTVGDFDGDGKLDVAAVNNTAFVLTIYRNSSVNGVMAFEPPADMLLGSGSSHVATADLNEDGKTDIVLANRDTISIYRNIGKPDSVLFAPPENFLTGYPVTDLVLADLDYDHLPEIVITHFNHFQTISYVSIFKNASYQINGISFAHPQIYYETGTAPNAVAIGDMNGDGKPDLATSNGAGSSFSILKGNCDTGVISFSPRVDYALPGNPFGIAVGDMNADGKPEVMVGNALAVYVHRNMARMLNEPVITSFLPIKAKAGDTIRIKGTALTGATAIRFGNIPATSFSVDSDTTISAIVATGGATGSVTVATPNGFGVLPGFTFIPPPQIISFTPTEGTESTTVTITGVNFKDQAGNGLVKGVSFGGTPAFSWFYNGNNQINVNVAKGSSGAIVVRTEGGEASKAGFIFKVPVPKITSFSPAEGIPGTTVTINGTKLDWVNTVTFGGVPAESFVKVSDKIITAVIGTGATGVIKATSDGGADSLAGFKWLAPPPVIYNFSPVAGPAGTIVTITGQYFSNTPAGNTVFFGAVKATVLSATATTLTVTVPSGTSYEPISVTAGNATAYARNPFLVTFAGSGTFTAGSFSTKTDFASGSSLGGIMIKDLDGDNKTDVAVANGSAGISVLKNTSTGGTLNLATKSTYNVSASPSDMMAGDVDGDGKPDMIAVTGSDIYGVTLVKNTTQNGTLSFGNSVSLSTINLASFRMAVGDLDVDGKPDVLISSWYGGRVSILKNITANGVFSFAPQIDYYGGEGTISIATGDLDGDGKPELVMLNSNTQKVQIWKNTSANGVISFVSVSNYATGANPNKVAIGDLDGDGKPDLAVVNRGVNTVTVYQNNSVPGTLSFTPGAAGFATGSAPEDLEIGDLDGDGHADIVTSNKVGKNLSLLRNISSAGSINFETKVDLDNTVAPGNIAIGDLNGDGKPDISILNGAANSVGVFINQVNNTAQPSITSFQPASAGTGDTVYIEGTNYAGVTAVSLGGVPAASFEIYEDSVIIAVVGAGATGDVSFTTPDGTATKAGFTFIPPPPAITALTPTSGGPGTTVVITGTYLAQTSAVSFGGIAADSFIVISDNEVRAVVGQGAVGNISLTTNTGTTTSGAFTFVPPVPVISSFTPVSGAQGAVITITGTDLNYTTGVSFGGTPATSFTKVSATELKAVVAAGTSGNVSVTSTWGTVDKAGFTYIPPVPVISSFTPASALQGATVTITGSNLSTTTAVSFGGVPAASFNIVSDNEITAVAGNGASGNIAVTTIHGTATKAGFTFIQPPPVITSITPEIAMMLIHEITITGQNFTDVTEIYFSGPVTRDFTVVSPTTIIVRVPLHAGQVVTVRTTHGDASFWTYITYPFPIIHTVTPVNAGPGARVTIEGQFFFDVTNVSFGGVPATSFQMISNERIEAIVGAGATGEIKVKTMWGENSVPGFTYQEPAPAPDVTSFTPTSAATGTQVTINGTNFTNASIVKFGGTPAASFSVVSATQIHAIVGTGSTGRVEVGTPSGADSLVGFTYIPSIPVISSFTPASGTTGTQVTINGTNFTGATVVKFGGTNAVSFLAVSPTQINAVVGAGSSGDVIVVTPEGADTLAGFIYYPPVPVITSFSPASATTGTMVAIHGSKFTGAGAVKFGNVSSSAFSVISDSLIHATVGTGASGDVVVITPEGSDTLGGFTYTLPKPDITSFSPTSARTGTLVAINGTGFTGATVVKFGGVPSNTFFVISDTRINAFVHESASGYVTVTTPSGTDSIPGFTFIPSPPAIQTFSPASAGPGRTVYITGEHFTGTTNVYFGGVPAASFIVESYARIVAVVGAGASGNIEVYTPYGADTVAGFTFIPPPVITSFTPTSAGAGTTVTIRGSGFTNAGIVKFGTKAAASYVVVSDSVITAIVNTGSTSGSVSVSGLNGIATQAGFTFIPPPFVNTFFPAYGMPGDTITINGSNLLNASAVSFGGTPAASFVVQNNNRIIAIVGNGSSGSLVITTPGGNVSRPGFSFIPTTTLPVINSFTPAAAAEGTQINFTGLNFTGTTAVSLGGTPVTSFTILSDDRITAIVGAGSSGGVEVTTPLGSDTAAGFTFIPASQVPTITSFSPTTASYSGVVTIHGTNLDNVTSVTFGSVNTQFVIVSATEITAKIGNGATGSVVVNTSGGGTASLSGFSYIPPPRIISFTPASATKGDTVTINGTNLHLVTALSFGGVPAASYNAVTSSQIKAIVGNGAGGAIRAFSPGRTDSLFGFNYIIPTPVITSFTPATATQGAVVTINGTNLNGATAVSFGGVPAASFTVISANQITATIGTGASGAVSVVTPINTASLNGFSYVIPQPVITSFTPISAAKGDVVTIRGTHLDGAMFVHFDSVQAVSFTVISPTEIRAVVDTGASGKIYVATPAGVSSLAGFTFIPPTPVITSFNPTSGGTGTWVCITGNNFNGTSAVSFGGIAAISFTVPTADTIWAEVGAGATGDISITTPGGIKTVTGFTFVAPVQQLTGYPNPASGQVLVSHPVAVNAQIQVMDLSGTLVRTLKADSNAPSTAVDLRGLRRGYYRIVWINGNVHKSMAVILQY